MSEHQDYVLIGVQHRTKPKEPTAVWSDWRPGSPNLSEKAREFIEVQDRDIFVKANSGAD